MALWCSAAPDRKYAPLFLVPDERRDKLVVADEEVAADIRRLALLGSFEIDIAVGQRPAVDHALLPGRGRDQAESNHREPHLHLDADHSRKDSPGNLDPNPGLGRAVKLMAVISLVT
jgi:hypothetical protein